MNAVFQSREARAAELVRVALEMLEHPQSQRCADNQACKHSPGELAQWLYQIRGSRLSLIDDEVFADPAWDILLDLYIQEAKGKHVSVTSACIASRVPSTTGLRWIAVLSTKGLICRMEDAIDKRRSFVKLTPLGRAKMHDYMASAALLLEAKN